MKKFRTLVAFSLAALATLTSCTNTSVTVENQMVRFDFTMESSFYNVDGYWDDVYNPEITYFPQELPLGVLFPFFSHKAQVDTYDGVEYKSFTGFCPSVVRDASDHTGQDWTQFQFGAIADTNNGYMIAHWDVRETESTPDIDRSCWMDFSQYDVLPIAMTVTNTSYAYWVMRNGSAFSRPFGENDYLRLTIHGVKNGVETGKTTVDLASNGKIVDIWKNVDLTPLGKVNFIYFTMESSDSGEWGMNTPAYFAIGDLSVYYTFDN